jgi:DNA helicase-2/ATP-dependent DNA helicase PcrA
MLDTALGLVVNARPPARRRTRAAAADPSGDPQERAIAHGSGPCLVISAPGSGKTYVITQRFIRLVRDERLAPGEVLALAYNRRAADELQARVEDVLGPLDGDPPVTTYHAWAASLVRRFGWHLGYPETLRIATDAERWLHLAAALAQVRPRALYNPARPYEGVREVKTHVERCKQELVTPEHYLKVAAERVAAAATEEERSTWERARDLARVYECLQDRYRTAGLIDHDDSIAIAARLLEKVPAVTETCAAIRHVMVDEFQDTNSAQAVMVERLVARHRNVLVVADDDQAIYRFRGASRLNIERFRRHFSETKEIRLLTNRRSTPQIVDVAQAVIAQALHREVKTTTPHRADGAAVSLISAHHAHDEAQAVVDAIGKRLAAGARPSSIAVLTQFRADLEPIAARLAAADIPYVTTGGRELFRAPEVKGVMALLEAITDPDAGQAILRCAALPSFAISNRGRVALSRALRDDIEPLPAQLARPDGVPGLDDEDRARARALMDTLIDMHLAAQTEDVRNVFTDAMTRTAYHRLGEVPREVERRQFAANVSRIYEILEDYCAARADARFDEAFEYLCLMREAGAEPVAPLHDEIEGVVLSTIHSAKGLEWDHVILPAAVQDRIPSRDRSDAFALPDGLVEGIGQDTGGHKEEQRRLFYVALTRARDTLTMSWARRYSRSFRDAMPTEFLTGVPDSLLERVGQPVTAPPLPHRRQLPELAGSQGLELSYSLIQSWRDCPRRFEYRRLWKMVPVFSPDGWYGDRLHGVLRDAMRLRMAGRDVDEELIAELWSAEWRAARGPRGRLQHLFDEGRDRLVGYLQSDLWAQARPHWVEHGFTIPVDPAEGWWLTGRVDRLDLDSDGTPEVVDYKTGRPGGADLARNLQLKVYAIVAARHFGVEEVRCHIHWLQTETAASITWNRRQLDGFLFGIHKDFGEIKAAHSLGAFPARPSAYNCGRCPYRVICPERSDEV